ncbi:MAG TPA: Smr/MutS family protein [Syntrophobacteria bacterium]|nr:Smr/MutS family protein [Syntrophobacteria bacterium]
MNHGSGTAGRIRYFRLAALGRLILLALAWPSGLYLVLGGVEPLLGLLCLLVGIWLLLDNPLEFLAIFTGTCPGCGAEVTGKGRGPCRCPSCGAAIKVEERCLCLAEPQKGPPESAPKDVAETEEDSPFGGPLPFAPGDTLDLHTFSAREVDSLVDDFLELCEQNGITRVRIIHGKGAGVLRRRVQALLARDHRVMRYQDAPPEAGGWGATVVELRSDCEPQRH